MKNETETTRKVGRLKNGGVACDIRSLPRCSARAKSTGQRCKLVAMRGKTVCWRHGGRGGAPKGNRNARKHGLYSEEWLAKQRQMRLQVRKISMAMKLIDRFATRYLRIGDAREAAGLPVLDFDDYLRQRGIEPIRFS